jgi:hypothetical protein
MKLSARIDAVVECLLGKGVDFQPIEDPDWILNVERRIGCTLPETYRNLVLRYSFPQFEIGPVILFSNLGDGSDDDITWAPFRDPFLSPWVIQSGHFHFARLSSGSYDPVCLDLTAAAYPKQTTRVVKFDHEAILCELRPVLSTIVSESFLGLLEEHA